MKETSNIKKINYIHTVRKLFYINNIDAKNYLKEWFVKENANILTWTGILKWSDLNWSAISPNDCKVYSLGDCSKP